MTDADKSPDAPGPAAITVSRKDGAVVATVSGAWIMTGSLPDTRPIVRAVAGAAGASALRFEAGGLSGWDSRFLSLCRSLCAAARQAGLACDLEGLPEGVRSLLDLADKVPERKGAAQAKTSEAFLARVGDWALSVWSALPSVLEFLGDTTLAFVSLVKGRAVFQTSQLTTLILRVGAQALPIVSLISLLVGLILAFVASIQLRQFGAQIYVATIVGIAMVRVMGAIMTGIIMAGRTGAAFAAEIGAMQVNEEVDALTTFGFSPTEFLVMPRVLALVLMMPLLCLYADLMGVLGGFLVGVVMLGITPAQYMSQTFSSIPLPNLWIGLVHSTVFGVLVALAGCYQGIRCGRSAMAVGQATTAAVVSGILLIVIATAIITWLCNIMGV
ncbi:ABC transporter permease [Fundidesulfovibrio butyratiphilus]